MKLEILIRLIIGALVALAIAKAMSAEIEYERFLDALAQIESGGDHRKIGQQHERGAYQIRREAWTDVSAILKSQGKRTYGWTIWAHDPAMSRQYAAIYVRQLAARYTVHEHWGPTVRDLYCMWNLGYEGYRKRGFVYLSCPPSTRDAAERLERLMNK